MTQWILPNDRLWLETLAETDHDFYHLPCYVDLTAELDNGEPMAFYTELPTGRLLIPLLIRDIPSDVCPNTSFLDATSPYGFPGPLFSKSISVRDAIKGIKRFIEFGRDNGLVTTFLRLHPFLSAKIWTVFSHDYRRIKIVSNGATVSIDLTLSVSELNNRLRRNHRQNINRLYNKGFTVLIDDWSTYPEFIDIYHETMRRCGAAKYYFFEKNYFLRLKQCLGDKLHICSILSPEGELAGGGLIVKTDDVAQAHLSATADKYRALAPSKLMFYAARNWAKSQGARIFHLGGGVGGGVDSLYQFKRGLGTQEHLFKTIGIIHDLSAYNSVYQNWLHTKKPAVYADTMFFPFYRRGSYDESNQI